MIKIVELFGGIGAFHKALTNLKIDYEILEMVENDKKVVQAYNLIHNTNFKPIDILKTGPYLDVKDIDFLWASPPCQAFSVAGLNKGVEDERGLQLWKAVFERVKAYKPKILIVENVKGLLNKAHKGLIDWWKELLSGLGYKTELQVLNAKDFGVPQNRERVFIVSSKEDNIVFPKATGTPILKWILQEKAVWITQNLNEAIIIDNKYAYFKNQLKQYYGKTIEVDLDKILNPRINEINKVAKLKQNDFDELFKEELKDLSYNSNKSFLGIEGVVSTLRGQREGSQFQNKLMKLSFKSEEFFTNPEGITGAMVTSRPDFKGKLIDWKDQTIKYRLLTPLECFRLMGFDDKDYQVLEKHKFSKSKICAMAGNSVVVNIIVEIMRGLIYHETN